MLLPGLAGLTVLFWLVSLINGLSGRGYFPSFTVFHLALAANLFLSKLLKSGADYSPEGDLCRYLMEGNLCHFLVDTMDNKDFNNIEGSRRKFCFDCMGVGHTANCKCAETYHFESFALSVPISGWRVRPYFWWLFTLVLMLCLTLQSGTLFLLPFILYTGYHFFLLTSAIMHGMTVQQMMSVGELTLDPYHRLPEHAFEVVERRKTVMVRENGEEKEVAETYYKRVHKNLSLFESLKFFYQ